MRVLIALIFAAVLATAACSDEGGGGRPPIDEVTPGAKVDAILDGKAVFEVIYEVSSDLPGSWVGFAWRQDGNGRRLDLVWAGDGKDRYGRFYFQSDFTPGAPSTFSETNVECGWSWLGADAEAEVSCSESVPLDLAIFNALLSYIQFGVSTAESDEFLKGNAAVCHSLTSGRDEGKLCVDATTRTPLYFSGVNAHGEVQVLSAIKVRDGELPVPLTVPTPLPPDQAHLPIAALNLPYGIVID